MTTEIAAVDVMEGAPIRCTIELTGDGRLTVSCAEGCTEDDARDLCALVARADSVVEILKAGEQGWGGVGRRVDATRPGRSSGSTMKREQVEEIVCAAQQRSQAAFVCAFGIRRGRERDQRLATLWEREARWWRVLLRHVDPQSPYLWAVVQAHNSALRNANTYRELAGGAT